MNNVMSEYVNKHINLISQAKIYKWRYPASTNVNVQVSFLHHLFPRADPGFVEPEVSTIESSFFKKN